MARDHNQHAPKVPRVLLPSRWERAGAVVGTDAVPAPWGMGGVWTEDVVETADIVANCDQLPAHDICWVYTCLQLVSKIF